MATTHRSFRLSAGTSTRLDERAAELQTSRSELAERLLAEGLQRELHPQIDFRWVEGERRPFVGDVDLAGLLHELRRNRGDVAGTARLLRIEEGSVRATLDYYGAHRAEADALVYREMSRVGRESAVADRTEQLLREMRKDTSARAAADATAD